MKHHYLSALLCVASVPAMAGDFAKNADPQVFEKSFEAMHYVERAYEIGRSTIVLSVNCLDSKQAVEKALLDKQAKIEQLVDKAATALKLGEPSEIYGHDYDEKIGSYESTPIQEPNSQNEFKWVNVCTGAKSDAPVRAKNVFSGSKVLTVWFPNQGEVLNHLTALVTEIEKLKEEAVTGVKVECNSVGGTNYDLAVSKKTEAGAWEEIEAIAKKRAREKVQTEFATVRYDNIWKGKEYFVQGGQTRLPSPLVEKDGGRWVAKFSDHRNYSVFVKQAANPEGKAGKLTDVRNYGVTAQATSTDGLYGTLTINVNKGCLGSQEKAEKAVAEVGNPILVDLRLINKGQNTESNRLKIKDATGTEVSPWRAFKQVQQPNGGTKYSFYNVCTLEVVNDVAATPKSTVWEGSMQLTIAASDLDALSNLRDTLTTKHKVEINDPNQVTVRVGWSATAILSVLENLAGQLETNSFERFLDDKSEFRCEAGNLAFACISSGNSNPSPRSFQKGRAANLADASLEAAAAPGGSYSEGVTSNIDANERGVATFKGKYVINYTLRKVLLNNEQTQLP